MSDDDFDELDKIADTTTFSTGREDARGVRKNILSPMQRLQYKNIGGSRGRRYKSSHKITLPHLKCLEKPE